MKQTFVIILISISFSCSSLKFNNEFLTSSTTTLNTDFDKIQLKNDTVARVINVDEFDKNLKKLKAAPNRTIK